MNREEQLLEFDKIKELWSEYALTETVKKSILANRFLICPQKGRILSKKEML